MKKIIVLIGLILGILTATAQEPKPEANDSLKTVFSPSWQYDMRDSVIIMGKGPYLYNRFLNSRTIQNKIDSLGWYRVPYRDARDSVILAHPVKTNQFMLDTSYVTSGNEPVGTIFWDRNNHTFTTVLENGVRLQNGQEVQIYGKNTSGEIIYNGMAVSLSTNPAQFTTFEKTDITNTSSARAFVGLATNDIGINEFGMVTIIGQVRDIPNLTVPLIEKNPVYVSTIPGVLTSTMPSPPNNVVIVGNCERAHATQGRINVSKFVYPRFQDLPDVNGTPLTVSGQIPVWDNTNKYFDFIKNINDYEVLSNKENVTVNNSTTKYPTINLLKTYADSKVSDETYSGTWDGVTTIAPSKNAVYDKISTLESVNYCATSMTVNFGTLNQGTVSDLCSVGGTDVIIQERVTNPPFQVTFTFTGVQRISGFKFYGRYNGSPSHNVHVEAYNYTTLAWDYVGEFSTTTNKQWFAYSFNLPNNYLSSNTAQVRIVHQDTGNINHQMIFDYVNVNYGGGGGSGFITAGAVDNTPSGNISATNVQGAINELDSEKEPTLTKGNLTAGSTKIAIGGSGTNAVIGSGLSVDVSEANLSLQNIGGTVTDSQVPNTITLDNITQITNRSHTNLSDIGTNTHSAIDNFIASKGQNNGLASLDAGGKVPLSQLPASLMIYKGTWSPLTNTPTLADGVGTSGWVYRANLSGSVNLGSGTLYFYAGDWVIYNGTTWERSAGTDVVVSVNGQQGVVSLNTSHISENTNLYFTDARAQSAAVEDQIVDLVTNKAPSENAVFDALAGKAPASGSGNYIQNGTNPQAASFNVNGTGWVGAGTQSVKLSGLASNYGSAIFMGADAGSMQRAFRISSQYNNGVGIDFVLSHSTDDKPYNTDFAQHTYSEILRISNTGASTFASTIQATTAKLTNLTDGYLPYHISDADGLGNSPIYTDGTKIAVRGIPSFPWSSSLEIRDDFRLWDSSSSSFGLRFGFSSNVPYLQGYRETVGATNLTLQKDGGNVGIGTTDPRYRLHIEDNLFTQVLIKGNEPIRAAELLLLNSDDKGLNINVTGPAYASGTVNDIRLSPQGTGMSSVSIGASRGSGVPAFTANVVTGNVGIGTTNPQYTLDVNGAIRTTGTIRASNTLFIDTEYGTNADINLRTNAEYGITIKGNGGNVGIGYNGGTELTNNKLAVNGDVYINGGITQSVLTGEFIATKFKTNLSTNYGSYIKTKGSYAQQITIDFDSDNVSNYGGFFITSHNEANSHFAIVDSGNVGIGYSSGTEIDNNKLAVNGNGYFNGTLNSTGYLLNGNNLHSSLSSGYFPYWDGTRFVNSGYRNSNGYLGFGTLPDLPLHISTNGSAQIRLQHTGYNYWDIEASYANTNVDLGFSMNGSRKLNLSAIGELTLSNLASTNTRLVTASSTGQLGGATINEAIGANALTSGYLPYWDGSKLANDVYGLRYISGANEWGNGRGTLTWDSSYAQVGSINGVDFKIYSSSGKVILPNLSGTGTRLVTASGDGELGTITNGTGFFKNDGSGNWSYDNSTYLTSYTETDPTIYAWAKAATKPSYTYSEVGAQEPLVSGTNIKTINGSSLLGAGDLTISGGTTNLGYTASATNGIVTSDTGTDATIPAGSTTNASLMLPADKTKLDALPNASVQSLSGTSPTWNIVNGCNATLTLTGNTTITLSNLVAGLSGNLTVSNPSTAYTITFAGYNILVSQAVWSTGDTVLAAGGSKVDSYSWYYDGSNVLINGTLDYK